MNKNKIFKNSLNSNSKTINFKTQNDTGNKLYSPAFSKEWKNTIYSFNKEILSNIPTLTLNVNKIIRSYFDLFFKNRKFTDIRRFILLKRRRNFLRRIFTSNVEIKHTNNKIIINLYVLNREKKLLKKKYFRINNVINEKLIKQFYLLYKSNLVRLHKIFLFFNKRYIFVPSVMRKKLYIKSKIAKFREMKRMKHIFLKKIWSKLISRYLNFHLRRLRKYSLLYSLNINKFNKLNMLWILSTILNKIQILKNKKIEYNIISLKYFTNNPDLFTNIIALKLKRKKIRRLKEMSRVLNRTYIPRVNTIQERTYVKKYINKHNTGIKILKLLSNINKGNLDKLLNVYRNKNTKDISKNIYDHIKYKNIGGIRIEVKGRLTKRYRADRSIYSLRWKGGLKNIESSYQKISTKLLRGNVKSNTAYSIFPSKRRIGAFAVKGWISGK